MTRRSTRPSARRGWHLPLLLLLVAACQGAPRGGGGADSGGVSAAPTAASPASAPAGQAPPQRATVHMGGGGGLVDTALFVARDQGYFEQQALDVEITEFRGVPEMVPLLATGRLEAGHGNVTSAFFNALLQGVQVRIVNMGNIIVAPSGLRLVVRKELADVVRAIPDLRGRTIATTTSGGAAADRQLDTIFRQHAMTLDDVRFETVAFPDQLAALANGKIDAALTIEPFITFGESRDVAEALPRYPVQFVFYSPRFIQEQPDVARRYMVAYIQGQRYLEDAMHKRVHWDEVADMFVRETPVKDRALWEHMHLSHMETNGVIRTDCLEGDQDYYVRAGYQREKVDLGQVVDTRFAEYAVQSLGTHPD